MSLLFKYTSIVLYAASILGLAIYGCHRLWLLICWHREHGRPMKRPVSADRNTWFPFVTIQLPLFNERFVAERLLAAAASMNWPRDRMEVQVLDDSTDSTKEIVDKAAEKWRKAGVAVNVLRRAGRTGFKAGALAHGMRFASGEFFAIFDADFIPEENFLHRTIPHFKDPQVGMVQSRWGFVNQAHSWLTRLQALIIGPHFGIEQLVRYRRGLFFNFNGTAGVWRRAAIETSGGWQDDTVTEDLDLSYRAQMAGWRFIYLDDLIVLSEVPSTLSAFRIQQQRWARGSIQTARKILPTLLRSPQPLSVKFEACAHLLANLGWLFGAMVSLLLYPVILSRVEIGPFQLFRFDIPLMGLGIGAIFLFFALYAVGRSDFRALVWLPLLPVFSIGVAPSIALAVVKGSITKGGRFERTPKSGDTDMRPGSKAGSAGEYHKCSLSYFISSVLMFIYCLLPVYFAWSRGTWIAIPFLLIFPAGFALAALGELGGFAVHGKGALQLPGKG